MVEHELSALASAWNQGGKSVKGGNNFYCADYSQVAEMTAMIQEHGVSGHSSLGYDEFPCSRCGNDKFYFLTPLKTVLYFLFILFGFCFVAVRRCRGNVRVRN